MREKQIAEAIERMTALKMSKQCISAFRNGKVWESEHIGSLYEMTEGEMKMVEDIEKVYGLVVYHAIHNMFEFGECYSLLYVSKDEKEWKGDREDLATLTPLVYVKNIDADYCSEFGCIGIKPNIGGLVRTS